MPFFNELYNTMWFSGLPGLGACLTASQCRTWWTGECSGPGACRTPASPCWRGGWSYTGTPRSGSGGCCRWRPFPPSWHRAPAHVMTTHIDVYCNNKDTLWLKNQGRLVSMSIVITMTLFTMCITLMRCNPSSVNVLGYIFSCTRHYRIIHRNLLKCMKFGWLLQSHLLGAFQQSFRTLLESPEKLRLRATDYEQVHVNANQ